VLPSDKPIAQATRPSAIKRACPGDVKSIRPRNTPQVFAKDRRIIGASTGTVTVPLAKNPSSSSGRKRQKTRNNKDETHDTTWDCPDDVRHELYPKCIDEIKLMPRECPNRGTRIVGLLLPDQCRVCGARGHLGNDYPVLDTELLKARAKKYAAFQEWFFHRRYGTQ
jgi:hypothetical protein